MMICLVFLNRALFFLLLPLSLFLCPTAQVQQRTKRLFWLLLEFKWRRLNWPRWTARRLRLPSCSPAYKWRHCRWSNQITASRSLLGALKTFPLLCYIIWYSVCRDHVSVFIPLHLMAMVRFVSLINMFLMQVFLSAFPTFRCLIIRDVLHTISKVQSHLDTVASTDVDWPIISDAIYLK